MFYVLYLKKHSNFMSLIPGQKNTYSYFHLYTSVYVYICVLWGWGWEKTWSAMEVHYYEPGISFVLDYSSNLKLVSARNLLKWLWKWTHTMLLRFLLRNMFVMKCLIHLRFLSIKLNCAVLGRWAFLLNL